MVAQEMAGGASKHSRKISLHLVKGITTSNKCRFRSFAARLIIYCYYKSFQRWVYRQTDCLTTATKSSRRFVYDSSRKFKFYMLSFTFMSSEASVFNTKESICMDSGHRWCYVVGDHWSLTSLHSLANHVKEDDTQFERKCETILWKCWCWEQVKFVQST